MRRARWARNRAQIARKARWARLRSWLFIHPRSALLNVLIIRTSAMGDVVHSLPVLTALRRAWPRAKIGWVVEKAFAPLLAEHPDIDELIVVRLREWRKHPGSPAVWREMAAARAAMRRFAPDVALDLMGNHKGGLIAFSSGAPRTLGATRRFRREASSALWINEPVTVTGTHAVDRALAVLAGLGPELADGSVDFGGEKILPRIPEDARAFLSQRSRPIVTIQAGAGWGNKTYPAAWWGAVASQLRERADVSVWVPIAPGEEHLASAVVEASDGAARSVDATAFAFLVALLRASRLVLGGDTGPIHLAHAVGTPVLCLIGPTDPERNGPYRAGQNVMFKPLPCSYCYKRYNEAKACLLNLSPREVAASALTILQTDRDP